MDAKRALEHPLPPGMRDLLPDEAETRRSLSRTVLRTCELSGYRVVTPPAFEFEEVLERGLGVIDAHDVLRFIEPESGEVAVLRPDMTPQIARIVATRLHDHPRPFRLAYEGTVVRRRIGRAKKHRQIPQVGVELCGDSGPDAEREILLLAWDCLRAAGLSRFVIDLGGAGIVRALLGELPAARVVEITGALEKKDDAALAEMTRDLPLGDRIVALSRVHGGKEAVDEACRILSGTPAESAAASLAFVFAQACSWGLGDFVRADPGEVRGFAYYTGLTFTLYAAGPGEAIGGGGVYDDLLSRFSMPMSALGFGLDLDALAWSLREVGALPGRRTGVVVVGRRDHVMIAKLRARGIPAIAVPDPEHALSYAKAWGYALVMRSADLLDTATGGTTPHSGGVEEAADLAARMLRA